MNIHEHQAKDILVKHGLPIPMGEVATTPDEAYAAAQKLGGPVVVKAQVLVGGRGKAGGVKLARTPEEARDKAKAILGMNIKGIIVKKVLIAPAVDIAREIYLGMVIDRSQKAVVMMASAAGGVDIEEVARETPEKIIRLPIDPSLGLRDYQAREVLVDGLTYHEGLSAVGITGGIAGNVIPDRCVVTVNYRFAPDRSQEEALAHVREVFAGIESLQLRVTDSASGARPGLDRPIAQSFVADLAVEVTAKEGWTDVARFADLGVPAVNFGPGDPLLAHQDDERVPLAQLRDAEAALLRWLA